MRRMKALRIQESWFFNQILVQHSVLRKSTKRLLGAGFLKTIDNGWQTSANKKGKSKILHYEVYLMPRRFGVDGYYQEYRGFFKSG